MIDKRNLKELFRKLDLALSSYNEKRELVIYGGAAMISMSVADRATFDIDVFEPKIDPLLNDIIRSLGEEFSLGEHWINSTGKAFEYEMPVGWKERLRLIYEGSYLQVMSLGRLDMIFTKVLAELDRQEDFEDIISLSPSSDELQSIEPTLLVLEENKLWKQKVTELINKLKEASSV